MATYYFGRVEWSWIRWLVFALGVTALFYLPGILAAERGMLPGVYLSMGLMLGMATALAALNDYLIVRLRAQPLWRDASITLVLNLVLITLGVAVAYRLHLTVYEVELPQLLRRAYRVRFALAAVLAVLYLRYLHYRRRSDRAELENLQLREREAAARLAALQQKLDPHFLFNTLNTISGAVRQDQKEASLRMITDLAERYRYLLGVGERSLVTVGEEADFVEGYARLLAHRFGANFVLYSAIPVHLRPRLLPPLTLQLLVENAVKHNEVSRDRPLTVWIEAVDDHGLRVRNTYQPKSGSSGAGEGLSNLRQRYVLLAGRDGVPEVRQSAGYFSVTLATLDDARTPA